MSTPGAGPAETVEIGVRLRPRTARRAVAAAVVVVALAVSATGTVKIRDRLQTVTAERVEASIADLQSGRPGARFLEQRVDEPGGGLRTDPDACASLLQPNPRAPAVAGSLLLLGQATGGQLEVEAIVYTTPRAARSTVRSMRTLIPECNQIAVLSRQEGDEGVGLTTVPTKVPWWSRLDDAQTGYQLISLNVDAFPDTAVQIRRFGNVVLVGSGPPPAATEVSAVVAELIDRLS